MALRVVYVLPVSARSQDRDHERAAIIKLTEEWGEIDRSHRKLAHRGSRLGVVHVRESTAGRVLTRGHRAAGS